MKYSESGKARGSLFIHGTMSQETRGQWNTKYLPEEGLLLRGVVA